MTFSLQQWLSGFLRSPRAESVDLQRRGLITAGILGAGVGLLSQTATLSGESDFSPELVRPPASVKEEDFLALCARCGECMKACPTNGVHPAMLEGGLESMWTPIMNMHIGYCEYECNLCSQVCPTGAIREISVEEKKKVKIGLAFFDKNRCLPYAFQRTCIVCEEHCPTPQKAIWFEEIEVVSEKEGKIKVKQPHIDPDLCIGCGICVHKCVITDQRGVYITSVGETRNPKNRMLLPAGNSGSAGIY